MKLQKMLFRLDDAMDLRKCKGASWSWRLCGETIEGKQLTLQATVSAHTEQVAVRVGICCL